MRVLTRGVLVTYMDERKRRILQAIIDDYIDTAEPIGSRTIARKHELGLSSATIRNEMADLEEMGFLSQPHTSAGRIPSDKGYRLYVDQLMKTKELSAQEIEDISSSMEARINELTQLIRQASAVMSKITRYTSMAITPQVKKSSLKALQVVPIEPGKALLIVVTNAGIIRNNLIRISESIYPDVLIQVSHTLNDKLHGMTIEQINLDLINEIEREIGLKGEVLVPILKEIAGCINNIDNAELYLDGATNIFNYPEFRDLEKAKEFLNVLDAKDTLYKLLSGKEMSDDINIQIGNENEMEEIKDCSLITTSYSVGNTVIGKFGVIGPTRMEYSRVISSMNYIRRRINQEINRLIGEKKNE